MATIQGSLFFDLHRTAVSAGTGMSGIPNVSIVLQDINTGLMLAVLTDSNGAFTFTNVPNSNYQIVESYGTPATIVGSGDFALHSTVQPIIMGGIVPPISYAPNPPAGATDLDCTIRNTRIVNVTGNLTAQNFLNGPVLYTPTKATTCAITSPVNWLTGLDSGTFDSFSPGTGANTGAGATPPYNIQSGFKYVQPSTAQVCPNDGEYTIQNLMNNSHSNTVGTWWIIADHTTGNEMGRMMIVNGYDPGTVILEQSVTVAQNTNYLFTSWVLNLCKLSPGYANPSFRVNIFDSQGNILFTQDMKTQIPVNTVFPEWKEIGAIFNTGTNTSLLVQFVSTGPAATGNDYVIDDIGLYQVVTPQIVKSPSCDWTLPGGTTEWLNTIFHPSQKDIPDVLFYDILDANLVYVENSFTVDTVPVTPTIDGQTISYTIPLLEAGQTINICFKTLIL